MLTARLCHHPEEFTEGLWAHLRSLCCSDRAVRRGSSTSEISSGWPLLHLVVLIFLVQAHRFFGLAALPMTDNVKPFVEAQRLGPR